MSGFSPNPAANPSHIGRFRVLERVAADALCEAFLCLENDGESDRLLLVKLVHREVAADRAVLHALLSEARVTDRIPNHLVKVCEVGDHDGLPYVATEYVVRAARANGRHTGDDVGDASGDDSGDEDGTADSAGDVRALSGGSVHS